MKAKQTPETDAEIIRLMADEGKSLRKAAELNGFTASAFLQRCAKDSELSKQYVRAEMARGGALAEQALDDAESLRNAQTNVQVNAIKVIIDTKRWFASKLSPKFADKVSITGDIENPLAISKIERVIIGPSSNNSNTEVG